MDIKKGANNTFYIGDEDESLAKLTYDIVDDKFYINHVYVTSQLRGQGIAARLVEKACEYSKEEGLTVVPICSYASSYLNKRGN